MNKTILINARVLTERAGGPARYLNAIIHELSLIDRSNRYIIILNKPHSFNYDLPGNFTVTILPSRFKLYFEYMALPYFSRKTHIDIGLFPKNTFSPLFRGKKILVYNDIIYFEKNLNFREFKFFDNLHHKIMIPLCARLSDVDLAISDFTASRMMTLLHIPKDKIVIIKDAVEDNFRKISDKRILNAVVEKFNLKMPFFFYAGSMSPRKNLVRVIQAFAKIKDKVPHDLYITGGHSWKDKAVYRTIEDCGLQKRIKALGFLTEDELVAVYNLAQCFLYPSIYEGFGLPILEAQACGCPVITGTLSSCPEVAGDAALLVDPYSIDEIAEAMITIANNESVRKGLIRKGTANCKRFSWKKAARELLALIESM